MTIYLGLGANDGDRIDNLERAIDALRAAGFRLQQVSPVVESPAMLPAGAEPDWHQPYLNLVVSGDADWRPQQGLDIVKRIERDLGRAPGPRWSPRPIDIDLLRWHERRADDARLTLPHRGLPQRDFVLTPLLHLQPDLPAGENGESVFELTQRVRPIPLWMAVVNLTPDSFSDGGAWQDMDALDAYIDKLIARHVQIIDVGAESTRPGGATIEAADEWARLEPALARIAERLQGRNIRPWLSLDSRHPTVVGNALRYGINLINDVTGLRDPGMQSVARDSGCQVAAMHSLSVPVVAGEQLPDKPNATRQIIEWAEQRMETWTAAGLDLNRIILDPGIGFGKSAIQAFDILSHCRELRGTGLRILIGHSRKSFMRGMTGDRPAAQRDIETLGMALALCRQGVDIIRVHAPFIHMRAHLAWAHLAATHTTNAHADERAG